MNNKEEIKQIDLVISQLKALKSGIQKVDKLSDKSFGMNAGNSTPKAMQNASANLNFECMYLDKQRKATWKTIKEATFLEVSLEQCDYHPSSFHNFK